MYFTQALSWAYLKFPKQMVSLSFFNPEAGQIATLAKKGAWVIAAETSGLYTYSYVEKSVRDEWIRVLTNWPAVTKRHI